MVDVERAVVVGIALLIVFLMMRRFLAMPRPVAAACRTADATGCRGTDFALTEVRGSNPCLVLRARIGDYETIFCVDTGFAGPCLLSLPCVVLEQSTPPPPDDQGVQAWCDSVQQKLARSAASSEQQERALHAFLVRNRSSDFTSGCTMRLASIGTTKEQTSEMLLTPPLELRTSDGGDWSSPRACSGQPVAELLTSTPMPTLHLLTCDWLIQNAPTLLLPVEGVLRTNLSADAFNRERSTLTSVSHDLSGGSFVATVRVQGVDMRVTVDSGAACYLSIGRDASARIRACRSTEKYMQQVGANGENICSQCVLADVSLAGVAGDMADVPVLVNDMNLDGEDGYVGVCFLRHFDLCVTPRELLARRNAHPFDATLLEGILTSRACGSATPACAV